jgi:hypothetical protein
MTPERKKIIGGYKIEEYYWNGKMVVYIDNQACDDQTFDEVCAGIEGELDHQMDESNEAH